MLCELGQLCNLSEFEGFSFPSLKWLLHEVVKSSGCVCEVVCKQEGLIPTEALYRTATDYGLVHTACS